MIPFDLLETTPRFINQAHGLWPYLAGWPASNE